MRNIGGSIGIAIMTTFLARRAQMHQDHLVANVTAGNTKTLMMLRGMQANFVAHGADAVTAWRKSFAALYGMVQEHASMLAFVEAFWLMGVVFLLMIPFLPLLQYTKRKAARRPFKSDKVLVRGELPEAGEEQPEEEPHLALH
jgi:DHA2 family multidrug resistance protein